jgi:hypothetical protein
LERGPWQPKTKSLKYEPAILQINKWCEQNSADIQFAHIAPKKNQQSAENPNSNLIVEGNRE